MITAFVMGSQEASEICTQAEVKAFIIRGAPASMLRKGGSVPQAGPGAC